MNARRHSFVTNVQRVLILMARLSVNAMTGTLAMASRAQVKKAKHLHSVVLGG